MARKKYADNTYALVADIGGTNTRVALAEGVHVLPKTIKKYPNANYPGLATVLKTYLEDMGGVDCAGACVAVAGPVRDGVGELTNRDWTFDADTLRQATKAEKLSILNDLQAQGHAIPHIADDLIRPVIETDLRKPDATRLVIGVGTGFNAAPVIQTGAGIVVPPSEAGHANLPIRTDDELRLCNFIETAHGFPSVEDVLSGRGIENVYRWLSSEAGDPSEMASSGIMSGLESGEDERAIEAARIFVKVLGTVAGNLSLIQLPFGGVYLIGGMARALTPYFDRFGFTEAFRDKGRFSGFMHNFAVSVVEDDFAALTGCASHLDSQP